jgi:hypothetical protein
VKQKSITPVLLHVGSSPLLDVVGRVSSSGGQDAAVTCYFDRQYATQLGGFVSDANKIQKGNEA